MINTETVVTETKICDICNSVVDSFCKDSLISEDIKFIENIKKEETLEYIYKVSLAVSHKYKMGDLCNTSRSNWKRRIDLCIKCFDSIQKHLIGLSKKENESV